MGRTLSLTHKARSEMLMALLAVVVGVVAGYGAVVFRALISWFHNLFFFGRFSFDYDALAHTAPSRWGPAVILVPMVGAVIVVFLVRHFAPEAKGHGVPEVIDAINFKGGRIRPQVAAIKALASSISIGSGGSVGREGPIIQIGSTFGSMLATWLRLPEWQRLTLIAAGGGAGIAATFNTPIGGVLFAVEILLVEISARTLIPVMIATGTASIIGRLYFGTRPSFNIPALSIDPAAVASSRIITYLLLGVVLSLMGWLYTRSIYWFEDLFDRIPVNDYVRHVLGMAVVGVTMYVLMVTTGRYYVQGVGYATIQDILDGALRSAGWLLLLLLAMLKLLATALTLGSGASGGVFSPALFMGATLGAAFAQAVQAVVPALSIDPVGAAVVGMACMVGSSTGAAVTAVVMIFEMTRDFQTVIPLIIAVAAAYLIRRTLMADTIYTLKLTRRGQRLTGSLQSELYMARKALDFIAAPFLVKPADALVSDLPRKSARRTTHVILVGDDGGVAGVVTAQDLFAAQRSNQHQKTPIRSLAQPGIAIVAADAQVFDVIGALRDQGSKIALLTRDGQLAPACEVEGVLTWQNLVDAMNLSESLERAVQSISSDVGTNPRDEPDEPIGPAGDGDETVGPGSPDEDPDAGHRRE